MSGLGSAGLRLSELAAVRGEAIALRQKRHGIWHETSWQSLARWAEEIASGLTAREFPAGGRVAIVAEPSERWLACLLGIWQAGRDAVVLSPEMPPAVLTGLLAEAGACAVMADGDDIRALAAAMRPAPLPIAIEAADTAAAGAGAITLAALRQAGGPAMTGSAVGTLLVATDGEAGPMRLATIGQPELAAIAARLCQAHGIGPGDRTIAVLPAGDPTGLAVAVFVPLLSGSMVHLGESTRTLADDLRQTEASVLIGSARMWQRLHRDVALVAERSGGLRHWALGVLLRGGATGLAGRTLLAAPLRRRLGLRRLRVALSVGDAGPETERFFAGIGIALRSDRAAESAEALAERALRASLFVRHAGVRPACGGRVALVQPDASLLGAWAARQGLAFTNYASLVALPEAVALIDAEIQRTNATLPEAARLAGYVIAPQPLSVVGGALTPLLALRADAADAQIAAGPMRPLAIQ